MRFCEIREYDDGKAVRGELLGQFDPAWAGTGEQVGELEEDRGIEDEVTYGAGWASASTARTHILGGRQVLTRRRVRSKSSMG
jgi:hypothetical protein